MWFQLNDKNRGREFRVEFYTDKSSNMRFHLFFNFYLSYSNLLWTGQNLRLLLSTFKRNHCISKSLWFVWLHFIVSVLPCLFSLHCLYKRRDRPPCVGYLQCWVASTPLRPSVLVSSSCLAGILQLLLTYFSFSSIFYCEISRNLCCMSELSF